MFVFSYFLFWFRYTESSEKVEPMAPWYVLPGNLLLFNINICWSSHYGSAVMNLTSIHEDAGSIPGLSRGLRIWHCCKLWCKSGCSSDLVLLWLWRRPAANAPI